MSAIPATPPSPGVGARRTKGPKNLPKLPLSAFSPPNSGVSESFPLPASPSTVHPDRVVDASVAGTAVDAWINDIGKDDGLKKRVKAVVLKAETGAVNGSVFYSRIPLLNNTDSVLLQPPALPISALPQNYPQPESLSYLLRLHSTYPNPLLQPPNSSLRRTPLHLPPR